LSVSAAIRKLIDAGMPVEQALMAAEAFEEALAPKRSAGAERTRRWRENKKAFEASQTVTTSQNVTCDAPTEPLPSSLLPREEKGKDEPLVRPKTRRADTSTRLPADWRPSDADFQFALGEGLSPMEVNRQADRFRDFWHAKPGAAGRKLDWPGTWRNWIRNEADKGKGKGTRNERVDRMAQGFADLYAGFDERDRQASRNDEAGRVLALPVQRRA
jgi:hypothetical protein